ncbi:ribonuclease E inhibitor RraA/Dimethylmenaquinone methyltransferase [Xylariaceae sp. FL1272]|nr:ribonuclease E inhibitor RraA/Dimethylmenaquinone methyltransferase [Xylariaceae sp. FL1272]
MASANLMKRFALFASCDLTDLTNVQIGDALVKLKVPYGGFLMGIHMWSPTYRGGPRKIMGPAVTVKMVEASDPSPAKPPRHFADCNEAGKIMYIQQPKGLYSACWGGLMSTRAQKLGALGTIIDGNMRDIEEHREMDYPVFARSTSILGSNTFTRASEVNTPVQFRGDLWINPDDILVADADGVVVVPTPLIEQVADLCQERWEIDQKTFAALREGAEMGETIKRLRK